jgi:hypothetical protein
MQHVPAQVLNMNEKALNIVPEYTHTWSVLPEESMLA